MSSQLGTPLPRRSPNWFWFVLVALVALYSTWAALFGFAEPWLPATFAIMAAFIALRPKLRNIERETVQVDDAGVLRVDGELRQQVRWEDVAEIRIASSRSGPWREDLFYTLDAADGSSCVVPYEAALRIGLLDQLRRRFPELDQEAHHDALESGTHRHFVLWRKSPGAGTITTIH